jgi:hypothetical protein
VLADEATYQEWVLDRLASTIRKVKAAIIFTIDDRGRGADLLVSSLGRK